MINQIQPEHYKPFIGEMDELEKFLKIVQTSQQNSVNPLKEQAQRELDAYIWNSISEESRVLFGSMDRVSGEVRQEIVQRTMDTLGGKPATRFYEHLDTLVGEINEKTLEALVVVPEIRGRVKGEDSQILGAFHQYKEFDAFVTRYLSTNQIASKREQQELTNAAIVGYAKSEEEKVKDPIEKKFVRAVAIAAMQTGLSRSHEDQKVAELIKKHAQPGLEERRDTLQEAYKKQTHDGGRDIYSVMREALKGTKELAKESPKEFTKIYQSVYAAEKGQIKYTPMGLRDAEE